MKNCTGRPCRLSGLFLAAMALGAGSFAQEPNFGTLARGYPTDDRSCSMAAVSDLDGDGAADVAVGCRDSLQILPGAGTGTLQSPITVSRGNECLLPKATVLADFDSDGALDVALACSAPGSAIGVLVALAPLGSASEIKEVLTTSSVFALAAGDFDGDDVPDLAATRRFPDFETVVLLGIGDGTFAMDHVLPLPAPPELGGLVVADFDGDGEKDLAVSHRDGIELFFGDGAGDFPIQRRLVFVGDPQYLVAADFNEDGAPDLAATVRHPAASCTATLSLFLGDGSGEFAAPSEFEAPDDRCLNRGLGTGDFDEDGSLDLLTSSGVLFVGDGQGGFEFMRSVLGWEDLRAVVVADIDADGHLDLVSGQNSIVTIHRGNGNAAFSEPRAAALPEQSCRAATVADLDGDGRQDVAVAYEVIDALGILLGDGAGDFTASGQTAVGAFPWYVDHGDVNRDGDHDLIVVNRNADSLSVLLGGGDGSFAPAADYPVGAVPLRALLHDLDGDGYDDLSVANHDDGTLGVLLNDGSGGFVPGDDFVATDPSFHAQGDLDSDGVSDLAVPLRNDWQVGIFLGDGAGGLVRHGEVDVGGWANSTAVADLNGDGHQDVAVAVQRSPESDLVRVFHGDGTGSFPTGTSEEVVSTASSLHAADLNSDGRPDLVISRYGKFIGVLTADGAGGLRPPVYYVVEGSGEATSGDVNGDGRVDLVIPGCQVVNILLQGPTDSDGDGVPDDEDACPDSDLEPTVSIDGCDSGVANTLLDDGCTVSDLVGACSDEADNHGRFVSCVTAVANGLKRSRILAGNEQGRLMRCAAH